MSRYVVDSNFFIQAHRFHYPIDIANSFWGKVKELADKEIIISIDKVKKEIYRNEDKLTKWCKSHLPHNFFKDSSSSVTKYSLIATWAASSKYRPSAKTEFLATDLADSWLVAYAWDNGIKIVTHEKSAPESKKRIKIPEVCDQFGVEYLNTMEMFRELRETF